MSTITFVIVAGLSIVVTAAHAIAFFALWKICNAIVDALAEAGF